MSQSSHSHMTPPGSECESCSICLETLFAHETQLITRLQPCKHYYHTACINLWQERSRQCPTCRCGLHSAETIDINHQAVEPAILLKPKTTTDAASAGLDLGVISDEDYDFFEEEDHDSYYHNSRYYTEVEQRIELLVALSNVCTLCDRRQGPVVSCNTCSSSFHQLCLVGTPGGDYGIQIGRWFCPMCSAEQLTVPMMRTSHFRRNRLSQRTNTVYNALRGYAANTINENRNDNEYDDDDISMTDSVRERHPLSFEEQNSWSLLDQAHRGAEPTTTPNSMPPPVSHRKLKRPTRRAQRLRTNSENANQVPLQQSISLATTTTAAAVPPPSSSKSLINTLLGQMKSHSFSSSSGSQSSSMVAQSRLVSTSSSSFSSSSTSSAITCSSSPQSSPCQSIDSIPTSPAESFSSLSKGNESKSTSKLPLDETPELSFEKKSNLQEIVRSKLRPFFKDGIIDVDQYTEINKKVSHILYEISQRDDYPTTDLEKVAEFHVSRQVMDL